MTHRILRSIFAFALFITATFSTTSAAVVYQYGFENLPGYNLTATTPWTGTPDVLATGLSNTSWATNYSGGNFISYDGSCGNTTCQSLAISGNNEPSGTTFTLTITVNPGYVLNITDLSFWQRKSTTGPTTANITINGIAAVNNLAIPTTAVNTGALTPVNTFTNLSGTVTLLITLTGATNIGGTFRLDDFVIDGTVTSTSTLNLYNVNGGGNICAGGAGAAIGLANSDTGVTYQLKNASHSNIGAAVPGTGSAISFGTITTAGTYTVVGTNNTTADTGIMTGSAIIVVNSNPTVSLTTPPTQCGGSVTLDAGNAGSTYLWSDNTTQQTITVTTSGSYNVVVTNSSSCSASASVSVTINTIPSLNFSATNLNICAGQSSTISVTGATTYLWSTGATTAAITVHPTINASYTVTGTDNNCTATGSASLNVAAALTSTITTSICQGLSYNGHTTGGTFSDTLISVGGCDSIVALTLQILPPVTSNAAQTICAGQNYQGHTTGGTFIDTLTSVTGCDSIVTLQLTVNAALSSSTTQTICNGLNYNGHNTTGIFNDTLQSVSGCDSIVSLNLTVMPAITLALTHSMCKYDTFMGYTRTGSYIDTLTAASGCDSLIYLQLTVHNLPYVDLTLTFDTICNNAAAIVLTGGTPAGGYYSGPGVSSGQFNPATAPLGLDTINYNYTDSNGCFRRWYSSAYTQVCTDSTDTSTLAVKNIAATAFRILPNPAHNYLTIENAGTETPGAITLYDLVGRAILTHTAEEITLNGTTTLNLSQLPTGLYLLTITTQGSSKVSTFKIVKD